MTDPYEGLNIPTITPDNRNWFQRRQDATRTWMYDWKENLGDRYEEGKRIRAENREEAKLEALQKAQAAALKPVGPSSQGSIRYPADTIESESDYVLFNFYRYTPPFKTGGSNTTKLGGNFQFNWGGGGQEEKIAELAAAENANTTPQQLLNQYNKKSQI